MSRVITKPLFYCLSLSHIHTHTHTHTHTHCAPRWPYLLNLFTERTCEWECEANKKYQCYPDADQAIIAPLASNPSSSSPSWKHAGGIQIPPAGPPWLCVSGVSSAEVRDMILNDTAAGLSISFDLFLHPLPPQQHTHIILPPLLSLWQHKVKCACILLCSCRMTVSGNICQTLPLPHGIKVRLAGL